MGDMADYQLMQDDFYEDDEEDPSNFTNCWKCKDGRKIKIEDLTDAHITNIIKWAKREKLQSFQLQKVKIEAKKRKISVE